MRIELELPNDIAEALQSPDLSRAALEAIAIEGYRSEKLGRGQVQRVLGFSTPMQVDAFLKEHNVYLNYTVEDLEEDLATLERLEKKEAMSKQRSA
jgi:predicted HTH domain antitoxin